jgi:hypothetical protein
MTRPEPSPRQVERFGYPKRLKTLLWVCFVAMLGFTLFFAALPWLPGKPDIWVSVAGLLLFGGFALASLPYLLRCAKAHEIEIDDKTITFVHRSGRRTTLRWDDIVAVRERPLLMSTELHGSDGTGMIRIENQLERIDRLRSIVGRRVQAATAGARPVPCTFGRLTLFWVLLGCSTAIMWIIAIAGTLHGEWRAAFLAFTPLLFGWEWTALTITKRTLIIRAPLRCRRIPLSNIDIVAVGTHERQGTAHPIVVVRLRSGKTLRLAAMRDGAWAFAETLERARQELA